MCWKHRFSRICFCEVRLNLLWLCIGTELQTSPRWAQMYVLGLGLGHSSQFGALWCVWHLDQLGAAEVCSGFVCWWGLKGPAKGRIALAGHWEGLAGRKLGLTKTNKQRRLQRKRREQLLAESLVRGPCWCHLGEDRQRGWALQWGVEHSHHTSGSAPLPHEEPLLMCLFRLLGRAGRQEHHLFPSPFCVPTSELLVAVY